MLLNEAWITENFRKEIKKFLEVNENDDTTYRNLWDTMKAVLRGKFIAWSAFQKRMKSQQLNDLTLQLKAVKKEKNDTKSSRRQEIIKSELKSMKLKQKKQFKKLTKQKVGSLKK